MMDDLILQCLNSPQEFILKTENTYGNGLSYTLHLTKADGHLNIQLFVGPTDKPTKDGNMCDLLIEAVQYELVSTGMI